MEMWKEVSALAPGKIRETPFALIWGKTQAPLQGGLVGPLGRVGR
ncbi:MAG: hypothetical protein ACREA2_04900 [Blastocatellia bacterium]